MRQTCGACFFSSPDCGFSRFSDSSDCGFSRYSYFPDCGFSRCSDFFRLFSRFSNCPIVISDSPTRYDSWTYLKISIDQRCKIRLVADFESCVWFRKTTSSHEKSIAVQVLEFSLGRRQESKTDDSGGPSSSKSSRSTVDIHPKEQHIPEVWWHRTRDQNHTMAKRQRWMCRMWTISGRPNQKTG